jgi:2-aminoethylphosphonate-pyruvate transaminase
VKAPRLAVILAAGRGSRLGPLGEEIPKGFITIGGTTLVERSLAALRAAGIDRVRIVTGHLADHYERLAERLGAWVSLAHNPDYATTGSLTSLLCAGHIDEPYLIVESDLLYEPRAPRLLTESADDDVLLASGTTGSGDEVYVAADNGCLADLSKQIESLRGPRVGELVGLTRVSCALHAEIVAQAGRLLAASPRVEYEAARVAASRNHPLTVLVVDVLVWTEVDDERHLARAAAVVAPRLGL